MHDNQPREHRRLQCRVQCRVLRRNADCDLTEKDPVISNSGGNCSSRNDGDRRFTHQRIFIQIFYITDVCAPFRVFGGWLEVARFALCAAASSDAVVW